VTSPGVDVELVLSLEGGGRRGVDDAEPVLRGDRDERHAFVPRGDHTGDQVRRARARVAEHGRDLAGRLVEPLGHVRTGCLVAHRYEADVASLERGKQRVDLRARQPEHEPHALERQAARERLTAGDLGHGVPSEPP
jgi:hypothetical protein